jgi:hypothetical protein
MPTLAWDNQFHDKKKKKRRDKGPTLGLTMLQMVAKTCGCKGKKKKKYIGFKGVVNNYG